MRQEPGSQCVHCGGAIDSAPFHDGRLMRCGRCAFVYPRASRRLDDPIHRDSDLIPGERYRLIAPLHTHGAGRVYLARHLVLDEPCVVKVLSTADPEFSPAACERFKSEAKAGFKIKHPNVARVLDCDRSGDEWYFVMEYVDGANLGEVVRGCGRLAWTQVVHLGIGAADGLSAIHAAGLLHRDIKPSNLILGSDGSVKIADLGLVDILRGPQTGAGSQNGSGCGTPHYMPPEQRDGRVALDERADLYALGATLYHLLVGHPLSHGRGPLDYLTGGDGRSPVDWPRDVAPPIPKWLRQIVEKCLASDREQRFASAEDLSAELSDWFASAEPSGADWQVPGIGTPRGVVVLPFENLSSRATDDWMGNALAEQIHNTLLGIEGVQVVDRHELLSLLGKMYAEQPSEATPVHRLDAARRVGAAVVVQGSFQINSHQVLITASALDADHPAGRVLTRVSGPSDEIFDLQLKVADEVAAALGYKSRRSEQGGASGTMARAAFRHYAASQRAFAAGQYAKAIECCEAGLRRDPNSAELLSLTGVCHARLGQYDRAITYHRQLEQLARQRDDLYRLAEATGNLGVMYYYKGEYPLAYELLGQAGQIEADLNLLPILAKNCNNLGFVLMRMERLGEADQAFQEAIQIKLSLGATASLVSPYNGRGEIALQQGRYDDALSCYRQALKWAEDLNDRVNIGVCHTNIGRCYACLQDYQEARDHLTTALESLNATEFWNGATVAYEHLAELYLHQQAPESAFECIEKRIDLAKRHGNRHMEAAAWEQKARAYELTNRKDVAMECLRKSFELQQRKDPYESVSPSRSSLPHNRSRS